MNIKKAIGLILFSLIIYLNTSMAQKEKEVAKNFGLSVAKSLIERDCDKYFDYLNDSIIFLQKKIVIYKDSAVNEFKGLCSNSIISLKLNYEYYLNNFEVTVLDYSEMKKNETIINTIEANPNFELKKGDFFFSGFYHKTENYMDFMINDAFIFILRKVGNEYKVLVFMDY